MAEWKHKVNVSDVWRHDDVSLKDKAVKLIEQTKNAPWYGELYYFDELENLFEEISDAADEEDVEWFDACLNAIYDIFDAERIWLEVY